MEENKGLLRKVLAVFFAFLVVLNIFRTESVKDQVESLVSAVDSLDYRIVEIRNREAADYEVSLLPGTDGKKVEGLVKDNARLQTRVSDLQTKVSDLQSKVTAMQKSVDRLSSGQRQVSSSGQSSGKVAPASSSGSGRVSGRVTVSAKVKVEDRYVEKEVLPKVTTGPEGVVVVAITIDPGGSVITAKIGAGTSVKDEEILEKCKEAALKTRFNINVYIGSKHPATITYTFIGQ